MKSFCLLFKNVGQYVICKARGNGNGYGKTGTALNCIFPFNYKGKIYNNGCAGNRKGAWCATKVDSKNYMTKWARCNRYCKKASGKLCLKSKTCLIEDRIHRIDIVSRGFENKNNNFCETKFSKMPFVYYLQIYKSISGYSADWTS